MEIDRLDQVLLRGRCLLDKLVEVVKGHNQSPREKEKLSNERSKAD